MFPSTIALAVLLLVALGEGKSILPILPSYDLVAFKAAHGREPARALTYAVDFTSQAYAADCKSRFESAATWSRVYKASRMAGLQVFWPNVASVEPINDGALYQPDSFSLQTDPFGYKADALVEDAGSSKEMVVFNRAHSAKTTWSEGQLKTFLLRPMVPSLDQLSEALSKTLSKRFPTLASPYTITPEDRVLYFMVDRHTNYHPSKTRFPMENWPLKAIVKWQAGVFLERAHQQKKRFSLPFFKRGLLKNIFPLSRAHQCHFDAEIRVLRLLKQQIDTCKEGEGFFIGATTALVRGLALPSPPQRYSFDPRCIDCPSLSGEAVLLHELHEGERYGSGRACLVFLDPSMPKAIPYDSAAAIATNVPAGSGSQSARILVHFYRHPFTFESETL